MPAARQLPLAFDGTMDICLRTNADDPCFELRGCRRLDQTDYRAELNLRSGAFHARVEFWFDRQSLEAVTRRLREMHESLRGECVLGYRYEEPHIKFKGDGLGRLTVIGLLIDGEQRLQFQMLSDQTALHSLVSDFQALLAK